MDSNQSQLIRTIDESSSQSKIEDMQDIEHFIDQTLSPLEEDKIPKVLQNPPMRPTVWFFLCWFFFAVKDYYDMMALLIPLDILSERLQSMMERVALKLLDGFSDNVFVQVDSVYNFVAIVLIYNSFRLLPLWLLPILIFCVSIIKECFKIRDRKILEPIPHPADNRLYEEKYHENIMRVTLSVEPLEEIYTRNER